jgi:hypothetical protein
MFSVMSHDILSGGTNENRRRSKVNPASMRLKLKIRSNLAPTKRINGTWVKAIDMVLNAFSFSSYKSFASPTRFGASACY